MRKKRKRVDLPDTVYVPRGASPLAGRKGGQGEKGCGGRSALQILCDTAWNGSELAKKMRKGKRVSWPAAKMRWRMTISAGPSAEGTGEDTLGSWRTQWTQQMLAATCCA